MKKRILVLAAVLILSASAAFATPFLQIGPMVAYNNGIMHIANETPTIHSFTFGADVRLNLFNWISIDVPATYGYANPGSGGIHTIGLLPSLNLNIPAASFLDIAIGVGLHMDFQYNTGDNTWYVNGYTLDGIGNAMLNTTLDYRLALTFNLGFVSIGATAFFPMGGCFAENFSAMPDWEETRVAVSVLFNLL